MRSCRCAQHVKALGWVGNGVIPIKKGAGEADRAIGIEETIGVRHSHAVTVGIHPGQRGQNVIGGVGNQRSVVIGQQGAAILDEAEKMRHLLKVGGHIRIVAAKVNVVELDVNDVADRAAGERATGGGPGSRCERRGVREPCDEQNDKKAEGVGPHKSENRTEPQGLGFRLPCVRVEG